MEFDPRAGPEPAPGAARAATPAASAGRAAGRRRLLDRRLNRLASGQHGVLTLAQLITLGLTQQAVSARVRAGRLYRVHQGVYAIAPVTLLPPPGRLLAAVLTSGRGAALSHRSAGAQHGLIQYRPRIIDVTVPARSGRQRRGVHVHRSATLRQVDVVALHGVATTTVARTLFDLAETLSDPAMLRRALDRAFTLRVLDLAALELQLELNRGRMRAAGRLTAALAGYRPTAAPSWNELEERFLRLVRSAGLPEPEVQAYLDLDDGAPLIQPDFLWRAQRLIVEVDGWASHGGRGHFERDRLRDQRAAVAGYRTVRFTWDQLTAEPGRTLRVLRALTGATAPAS